MVAFIYPVWPGEVRFTQTLVLSSPIIIIIMAQDLFGKQDPYVVVRVGQQTCKTKVQHGGGTSPVFNETFVFQLSPANEELVLIVREHDTFTTDGGEAVCIPDLPGWAFNKHLCRLCLCHVYESMITQYQMGKGKLA